MIYSIPPRNHKGKEICAYWDQFLSEEQRTAILALPEWMQTTSGVVGGQVKNNSESMLVPDIRSSRVAWLNYNKNTAGIWDIVSGIVTDVNSEFFHFDLSGMYEPMQLSVYSAVEGTGDHYSWHTDMSMTDQHTPRKLSMSLLLSDPSEFEGGDLQVKTTSDEIITLEPAAGRAWFFPSWVLHRVTPVTKGIRRSLVVWVGGPPFK